LIKSNAFAYGSITYPVGNIFGPTIDQNATSYSYPPMPPEQFPPTLPTPLPASYWAGSRYTLDTVTAAQCSASGFLSNKGANSFYNLITSATSPTAIDLTACGSISPQVSSCDYQLQTDIALVVSSFTAAGCVTYESSTSTTHTLSIVAPDPSSGVTISNGAVFGQPNSYSNNPLDLLIWTNGTFTASGAGTMTGQVIAQNSVIGSNGFSLTYADAAGNALLPDTYTQTVTEDGNAIPQTVRRYRSQ
jgi:hypothetical protein